MKILTIDAFASRPFTGNPAAICFVETRADDPAAQRPGDAFMQSLAVEMNLSETAFVRPLASGYELRWFTPASEVDLCGHATLAAAHALWTEGVAPPEEAIEFHTRSGLLTASRNAGQIELDFPAIPATQATEPVDALLQALGVANGTVWQSQMDTMVVVDSERDVRRVAPDMQRLKEIPTRGVALTSRSESGEFDFVSRFFAPVEGIPEDPVTGSAHCLMAPYWGNVLGKDKMRAFQASSRGGVVETTLAGDRVKLAGTAVTVVRGEVCVV